MFGFSNLIGVILFLFGDREVTMLTFMVCSNTTLNLRVFMLKEIKDCNHISVYFISSFNDTNVYFVCKRDLFSHSIRLHSEAPLLHYQCTFVRNHLMNIYTLKLHRYCASVTLSITMKVTLRPNCLEVVVLLKNVTQLHKIWIRDRHCCTKHSVIQDDSAKKVTKS